MDSRSLKGLACLFLAASLFEAGAASQAAELPSRRAMPDKHVKSCAAYGAGFIYSTAVDSCIRISGRVETEFTYGTSTSRAGHR
jgi:hypothetical protein